MRVVAGNLRSRQLITPKGSNTRPTTDKVKGAIYNMIGPYFQGGVGLDLYAGSGSLGIEALSRGLETVYFVDQNFNAIKAIKQNIKNLNLEEQVQVLKKDASQALVEFGQQQKKFDLVLLDPPYAKQDIEKQVNKMLELDLLNKQALIVCELDKDVKLELQTPLTLLKENIYGISKVKIYRYEE